MRIIYRNSLVVIIFLTTSLFILTGCLQKITAIEAEENDMYDGPDKAIEFEIERTHDLTTGKVPWEKLRYAMEQTELLKNSGSNIVSNLSWTERGPNGDFSVGGNPRPNNDQTAGRIRAAMIDSLDATHKTVWVGGVDGGLWKTTDITAFPATWVLINDFLANLAVSAICQDPRPGFQNNMYFCTGESFRNGDGVRGVGVYKSTDAGATWNFLPNTSGFTLCSRILCDYLGNVYLGTRNTGLRRSNDGGTTWTDITPTGVNASICDIEISSTSAAGRLHMATGIGTTQTYRYTDIPSTVSPGTGWNVPTTAFPSYNERCEMAIRGNVLYACPVNNATNNVPTIYKTTDGGDNWVATTSQPNGGNWANGQGWYSLSAAINPVNSNEFICGGLDCWKTTDGGGSWTKISTWAAGSGQYVHADQHNIQWWDGGNKLMFTCDGGVHFSTDGGTTIRDRNKGLRLKQFYSIAIHPTRTNYFLAGAQDNGMHRMDHPGLDSSIECVGGDGCYAAIDQLQPQYQFGSYVYNVYRRSVNDGVSWSTPVNNQSTGRFVNPWDYDNNTKIIYACNNAGTFLRWNDPQTGSSTDVVTASAFSGGNVSAVFASPYTANRVYFGTGTGGIIQVDNANTGTSLTGTIINTGSGMPAGYVNCIVTGSNDQNLMATFTNYGVQNVWVTTNGGTTWTAVDGNLPDMPVRWALFHPDVNTKAFIATETGVWETDLLNGASTVWAPSSSFPNVRTDMIKYRAADRTIAAGTHGRGIWSAAIPSSGCTPASVTSQPSNSTICTGTNTSFSIAAAGTAPLTYQWQLSISGCAGPWNNISNGAPYSGATTTTLTITGATAGMNNYGYRCVVTGNCAPLNATSNCALLTIVTSTSITSQPANSSICAGNNSSFAVTALGAGLTYQWQASVNGSGCPGAFSNISNTGVYNGTTTATLTITGAGTGINNTGYRCIVTGTCGSAVTTNCGLLTVNTPISITSSPSNSNICASGTTSFTVAATGTTPGYQWQVSTNGAGGPWNNISNGGVYNGATTTTLTLTGVTTGMNGYQYRAFVSGAASCGSVNSGVAILSVNAQPVVSLTVSPYTKLLPVLTTTITALVTPSFGSTTVWSWNGSPLTVTGNSYTVDLNHLGVYTVVANIGSCISAPATITIADSASSRLFIFPSPNDGYFTIAYYNPGGGATTQQVNIYDALGQRVYSNKVQVNQAYQLIQVDMRGNASGIYEVVMMDANGKKVKTGRVAIR